jgi:hypothetical protein
MVQRDKEVTGDAPPQVRDIYEHLYNYLKVRAVMQGSILSRYEIQIDAWHDVSLRAAAE